MSVSPPATPTREASEMQSSITLLDFFQVWARHRVLYLVGLAIVVLGTALWSKLFLTKYYRAQSGIVMGSRIPLDERIGFSEIERTGGGRNDQYHNARDAALSEQYLNSTELLLSAAGLLKEPEGTLPGFDLYEMLGISEENPQTRDLLLAEKLRNDLINVKQVQATGIMTFSAELPDPAAAARFVNICVRLLQVKFRRLDFGYYEEGLKLYRQQLDLDTSTSQRRMEQIAEENRQNQYDQLRPEALKKEQWNLEMHQFARRIAEMQDKIVKWSLATNEQAQQAAQPVKVINEATPPLKKNRPKTSITVIVAAALYTFFFTLALVILGYAEWSRRNARLFSGL